MRRNNFSPAMQPIKRSHGNNLLLFGAPAKKVPEPPVSNDGSDKPSILKAFEAVLAAGRRGLLGPAAMAAVEGTPDLGLECCDGKFGQEAPSSVPLLGEREEGETAEEKKRWERGKTEGTNVVNKESNIDVPVPSPVKGTESGSCKTKHIWMCGDHVIWFSEGRSQSIWNNRQLDIPATAARVMWRGSPKMKWDDLLPNLHQLYHQSPFPSIIVIHLGKNDLLFDSSHSLVTRMQNDLVILRRAFQDVVIIWSSLLPGGIRKPAEKSRVMESECNNVNAKMEAFCNENDIYYFLHQCFTRENAWLFKPDGTLSKAGGNIFVTDLRNVLDTYLDYN